MVKKPLVSIIVNCYNGEKFLSKCLNSIKAQTYKNFELIFWDNQSTDKSKVIFKSYKDKRFHYFKSNIFTTLYKARNLAIKKTKGKFISFLDTDDYWFKEKLEYQIQEFIKNDSIGMVYTNQIIFNKKTDFQKRYIENIEPKYSESEKILKRQGATILTGVIKKKEYLKLKKGFNNKYNIIGDLDLFFRLSKQCKIKYIHKVLAVYRLHENNYLKTNKNSEIIELKDWYKNYILKQKYSNSREKKIIKNTILLREIIFLLVSNKRFLSAKKIIFFQNTFLKIKLIVSLFLPLFIIKRILIF